MTKYKVFIWNRRSGGFEHLRTLNTETKKKAVEKAVKQAGLKDSHSEFFMAFPHRYWAQYESEYGNVKRVAP